ncbi:endonuclease toxin domain-containing protein [Stratiformator vulcanicus]|uniref:CdiA toxin EC869-like domain-containing protein n=1 Tax=Stratiformator vulcanicus TaxID=2527980 RepID=A0A517R2U1_9PLAN|nr:hypothetical protein [Stratiformator vulcanicus]QDT38171.1 hypothetical protein Pan189_25610 [Stratiformator vulcanicus]
MFSRNHWRSQCHPPRGEAIETVLGQNLPQNYPTVDRFADGVVTSIKSVDLKAPTYQNLQSLGTLLRGFVTKVKDFNGAFYANFQIKSSEITGRAVHVAIPPGASNTQFDLLRQIHQEAKAVGVDFYFTILQ